LLEAEEEKKKDAEEKEKQAEEGKNNAAEEQKKKKQRGRPKKVESAAGITEPVSDRMETRATAARAAAPGARRSSRLKGQGQVPKKDNAGLPRTRGDVRKEEVADCIVTAVR